MRGAGGVDLALVAIVGMFIVGMVLGWSLGRRDLVKELESLSQEVEV